MSDFIQIKAKECLQELGADEAARSITIRVVGNYERSVAVYPLVKKHFRGPSAGETYPSEIVYQVKNVFLFQRLDGVDVCLFAMYVQEYGDKCPAPNRRKVYISYLDSVAYFRPRIYRTEVYHSIISAYLDYVRRRGYWSAHIW
jgi:E1A/CREB-binding protein